MPQALTDNEATAQPTRTPMVESLFAPLQVRAYTATTSSRLIEELQGEERDALAPMVASRQAEYATARACARAALVDLGIAAAVPKQADGAPLWPEGAIGSISHTKGFCLAVASTQGGAIGLDVELVHRIKPSIERRILVDQERENLEGVAGATRRAAVATIFAAKEAFYKAHYEVDPRYIGFDAVAVEFVDGILTFSPGSGAVAPEVIHRTTGRSSIEYGRAIAGVTIGSGPLPSPA